MSTHTQGKLTHKRLGVIVGGPVVEFARGSGQRQLAMVCGVDDGSEIEDNARRLVAAWNACDGVPTDALEQIEGFGKAALPYHELKAQRDELLAALKGLVEAEESMRATYTHAYGKTPEDEDHYGHEKWAGEFLKERADEARSAITNAEVKP